MRNDAGRASVDPGQGAAGGETHPHIAGATDGAHTGGDPPPAPTLPTSDPGPIARGSVLGSYEILERIGDGGMGAVWKARHTQLDKLVAFKVLPARLTEDPATVSRFKREMKAVGKLEHPHIVRAMDAGMVDGVHYLVMEFVEGQDLARLVAERGPRKIIDACEIIRQAASALGHAHEHHLVHRDVKPSNLLLTRQGKIKLLDLGLALLADGGASHASRDGLTVVGQIMGTPDYMAPEQWEDSHRLDGRADLYALGCTLYFLLTGRPPFGDAQHQSVVRKMSAHVGGPRPSLSGARPDVPAELEAIYQTLLAPDPGQRFATARDLVSALTPVIRHASQASQSDRAEKAALPTAPSAARTDGAKTDSSPESLLGVNSVRASLVDPSAIDRTADPKASSWRRFLPTAGNRSSNLRGAAIIAVVTATIGAVLYWRSTGTEEPAAATGGRPSNRPVSSNESQRRRLLTSTQPTIRPSWTEFRAPGQFVAMFPGIPREQVADVGNGGSKRKSHTWLLVDSDRQTAFSVSYSDFSGIVGQEEKRLVAARDKAIEGVNGRLLREKTIEVDGNSGLEFFCEGTQKGVSMFIRARMMLIDQRLYMSMVVAESEERLVGDDPDFFLRSVRPANGDF